MFKPTRIRLGYPRRASRTTIKLVSGLAVLCGIVPVAAAQSALPLSKGTRVRVVIPAIGAQPERQISGTMVRLQNDTVVIWTGAIARPESVSLALETGRRLEALASHGHGGKGAAVGALMGALTGAFVGAATWQACTGGALACIASPTQGEEAAGAAIVGAAGGALLGLVIGTSVRTETWVPVQTAGVRVAVIPRGLGISLGF